MGRHINGLIILAFLAITGPFVSGTGAVLPGGYGAGPVVTVPDLNVSGINGANRTIPDEYKASPVPIRVEVPISDTLIPGPKGEMQAGPRAIGFTADPVALAVLAVAIIAASAGMWYLIQRKPEETEREDDEGGK